MKAITPCIKSYFSNKIYNCPTMENLTWYVIANHVTFGHPKIKTNRHDYYLSKMYMATHAIPWFW
jgi:hypothetical protein